MHSVQTESPVLSVPAGQQLPYCDCHIAHHKPLMYPWLLASPWACPFHTMPHAAPYGSVHAAIQRPPCTVQVAPGIIVHDATEHNSL
jgi:hypothetical protein